MWSAVEARQERDEGGGVWYKARSGMTLPILRCSDTFSVAKIHGTEQILLAEPLITELIFFSHCTHQWRDSRWKIWSCLGRVNPSPWHNAGSVVCWSAVMYEAKSYSDIVWHWQILFDKFSVAFFGASVYCWLLLFLTRGCKKIQISGIFFWFLW